MQTPIKVEEPKIAETMEEKMAHVGAKIDDLIEKAARTRDEIKARQENKLKKADQALNELKLAMDSAWTDLNHAWKDIKDGTERAAHKLNDE